MSEIAPGLVSVVLVNYRGVDDTVGAIEALRAVDWPRERLEIVVVDNDSQDGSAERLAEVAGITLLRSPANVGFAGGCNAGVAVSSGEYVAFLNNDARPDAGWIREAVASFEADPGVAAVASKVLDEHGHLVDFIDAGLTWFGKGYKPFVGEVAGSLGEREKDVLFGTGSAMFVRREAYDELGGFDERFFMFYEDVDLGWRLNLRGWRFRYQPRSVAFHKHHGTVDKFGSFRETYFLERNALFALYKNVEKKRLDDVLPASLALTIRRAVSSGSLDSTEFDFRRAGGDESATQEVPKSTVAGLYAVDQFVQHLESLTESRRVIQSSRRVSDRELWSLFGRVDAVPSEPGPYVDAHETLVDVFPVTDKPGRTRVLIITGDPIGAKMAGPAIRAWNMASALSAEHEVTLLTLSNLEPRPAPFTLRRMRAGDRAFGALEKWADVIVFQGHAMAAFEALAHTDKIVVADVYDPMHLEQLEQGRQLPAATWDKQVHDATEVLNEQLSKADFMLCASERQRMFYLGQLAALGRINPANYAEDPDLEGLISIVPFGFDATPPVHERDVLKGVLPGIGPDDKVLLWGGGLYNWFDPRTLIRAVALLGNTRPEVRLFFQGTKHPHPGVPEMAIVSESRALAEELGVLDRSVFFNESWVDYADRQNYLTEADAGVSTHFSHVETTFSFRTRILDYLWAGLPMVVTEGDSFAELVATERLGLVVPAEDPEALASALDAILFDTDFIEDARANVARVRERFLWSNTLEPLLEFVRHPRHASDLEERRAGTSGTLAQRKRRKTHGARHTAALVLHHLRNGGPLVVARKVAARLRSR
ncbi:MAG: glycosyl transferase [Rhodoglobus sp.]|nr:glycosyl transferase [Rhodoglobus sp.]